MASDSDDEFYDCPATDEGTEAAAAMFVTLVAM